MIDNVWQRGGEELVFVYMAERGCGVGVCIYGREGVRCGCLYIWQRGGAV